MSSPDLQDEVRGLRDKMADMQLSNAQEIGEVKAAIRVTKHETSNLQQMIGGMSNRLDRMETQVNASIKDLGDSMSKEVAGLSKTMTDEIKGLTLEIGKVTVQQNRGAGFFAGIGASIAIVVTFVMFMGKLLFGGGIGH